MAVENEPIALKMLRDVTTELEKSHIPYWLEGGTLQGIIREQRLLPWDNDMDISMCITHRAKLLIIALKLMLKGYRLSFRWYNNSMGTYKRYAAKFAKEITQEYNLIIRPHYYDYKRTHTLRIMSALKGIKHLYFSDCSDLIRSDTMGDFVVSDILISDTASVLYEYLITGNPIIIAENGYSKLHSMPVELNILNYVDLYHRRENINDMISNALAQQKYRQDYQEMLHRVFYFNDGKSTDRALDFLQKLEHRDGK